MSFLCPHRGRFEGYPTCPPQKEFGALMKALGYPRTISMDSFRAPNFELVADCLHWLILRYDPTVELDTSITTESHRVAFLKSAIQIMLARARIRLNPKRLYSADGYAVKELLKIATLLQLATNAATVDESDNAELGPAIKAFDVKATRVLVSEITKCGAALYDVLETEPELQEARWRATMMNTDMDEIEHSMRDAISAVQESIASAEQEQSSVERDEKALRAKYEKRKFELERSEKRLSTLQSVRPAYMDEYEVLQKDLHGLFFVYVEKLRNLQWLESQMESHSRDEQEKLDETDRRMRRLQRRLHNEELCILRGEEVADDAVVNMESSEESEGEGTNFWNWYNGGASKSRMQKDLEAFGSSSSDNAFPKRPLNWSGSRLSIVNKSTPDISSPRLSKRPSTQGSDADPDVAQHTGSVGEEKMTRTVDSIEASLNGSEVSRDLDEADEDLLDIDGIYNNDIDGNTSDDDF